MIYVRMFLFTAAALAAAILLPACSDDPKDIPPGGGSPAGVRVIDEANRTPVPGIKIVVMDPVSNEPLAGPRVTDGSGMVSFPELPVGRYPVLAYGGFLYRFSGFNPDFLHVVTPPQKASGLTAPGMMDKTPPAPESAPLIYLATPTVTDSLPRFSGKIVDSVTGNPLQAAFVGLNPYLTGYQGDTDAKDDVTDAAGQFSVSQIPLAMDPDSGNIIQLQPLLVVRHGYRPTYWRYDFPNGSQDTDIKDVTIALDPARDTDSGVLHGRIVRGGEPIAGLPVGLALAGLGHKVGPGLTGWGAVTDTEGRYRIKALPGGAYIVQPGYLVGDGSVFQSPPGFQAFPVMPGAETDAGDLPVQYEVNAVQPHQGSFHGSQPKILIWTVVPDAIEYEVRLDRGVLARVDVSQFYIPEDMEISPGPHTWEVGAFTKGDTLIGFSQIPFQFRITEPEE